MRARVIKTWTAIYTNPLTVQAGEQLKVGRPDDEWPGWVWCETQTGVGGWMPERLLDEAGCARTAYTARELTVQAGELITLHQLESGWYWATTLSGQSGWVPASHVHSVSQKETAAS
ncbi:MAG: hypothetical protein JNL09_05185 [Anaerolineales bacterium]|nr:hypothetical protein [Anaerolineales bacterium]